MLEDGQDMLFGVSKCVVAAAVSQMFFFFDLYSLFVFFV